MISITLRVLSRPDLQHLPNIYKTLGQDYDERVLPSIGNEVLKSIVAQFDAAELITQREVVCGSRVRIFVRGRSPVLLGFRADPRRPPAARGRVQHRARRRFHHPSYVWEGALAATMIITWSLTSARPVGIHPGKCSPVSFVGITDLFVQAVEAKQIAQQGGCSACFKFGRCTHGLLLQTPSAQNSSSRRCAMLKLGCELSLTRCIRPSKSVRQPSSARKARRRLRQRFRGHWRRLAMGSLRSGRSRRARRLCSR